jgi:hypothetical protein
MKRAAWGETSPWSKPERRPRRWLAANSGNSSPDTWRWARSQPWPTEPPPRSPPGRRGERRGWEHDELPRLSGGEEHIGCLADTEQLFGRFLGCDLRRSLAVAARPRPGAAGLLIDSASWTMGETIRPRPPPRRRRRRPCWDAAFCWAAVADSLTSVISPWARAIASSSRASWATSQGSSDSAAFSQ